MAECRLGAWLSGDRGVGINAARWPRSRAARQHVGQVCETRAETSHVPFFICSIVFSILCAVSESSWYSIFRVFRKPGRSDEPPQLSCEVVASVANGGTRAEKKLKLTAAAARTYGEKVVTMVGYNPKSAANTFGCAMAHVKALQGVRTMPCEYGFIFEDDVTHSLPIADARLVLERLIQHASPQPDVIYLGHTSLTPASEILSSYGEYQLRATRCSYGAYAYAVRPSAADAILKQMDTSGLVRTADGAIRAACSSGEITAAHVEYQKVPFKVFDHRGKRDGCPSRIGH